MVDFEQVHPISRTLILSVSLEQVVKNFMTVTFNESPALVQRQNRSAKVMALRLMHNQCCKLKLLNEFVVPVNNLTNIHLLGVFHLG